MRNSVRARTSGKFTCADSRIVCPGSTCSFFQGKSETGAADAEVACSKWPWTFASKVVDPELLHVSETLRLGPETRCCSNLPISEICARAVEQGNSTSRSSSTFRTGIQRVECALMGKNALARGFARHRS